MPSETSGSAANGGGGKREETEVVVAMEQEQHHHPEPTTHQHQGSKKPPSSSSTITSAAAGGENGGTSTEKGAAGEAAASSSSSSSSASSPPSTKPSSNSHNNNTEMLLIGGKPGLYHCNYCMRDISSTCRIKCANLETCPDWDLCLDCFGAGVELGKHKNNHAYRVVDNTNFPIFSSDWTATEELSMLWALEQHGMGNWGKVSELLGNVKEKGEKACMEHYIDLYMHSYGSILPKETLVGGEPTSTDLLIGDNKAKEGYYKMKAVTLEEYPEAVHLIDAPKQPEEDTPCPREKFKPPKGNEKGAVGSIGGGGGGVPPLTETIPGYMPLRGDFDVEHDNEAELILADMEMNPGDDSAEKQLKLMVIDVFNRKLDERERRKTFVKEYGLIDYKTLQNKEKRKPRDERELIAKLRVFARYQSPADHEQFVQSSADHQQFVQGILEAKRLRKRIEQLQQYRRLGIRTQSEALAYENEKRKRETEQKNRKQRETASYLYDTAKSSTTTTTKDRTNRYKKRNRDSVEGGVEGLMEEEGGKASATSAPGPGPLDIEEYPGAELLSVKERELCGAMRLLPKHYLFIKKRLLEEAKAEGLLSTTAPRSSHEKEGGGGGGGGQHQLVSMDVTKKKGVYDFMVQCGWVTARGGSTLKDITVSIVNKNEAAAGKASKASASSSSTSAAAAAVKGGGGEKMAGVTNEEEEDGQGGGGGKGGGGEVMEVDGEEEEEEEEEVAKAVASGRKGGEQEDDDMDV